MPTYGVIGMGRMGQSILSVLEGTPGLSARPFYRLTPDTEQALRTCDVVIEFTTAEAAPGIIKRCIELQVPVVSGTTGWQEYHLSEIITFCKTHQGKFLHASNFSIGMNIVFALNSKLASLLTAYPEFKPALKEIHHIHKKDSPSGTAYTLVEEIIRQQPQYAGISLQAMPPGMPSHLIPVEAIREGEVKGYHEVIWSSGLEKIALSHEAFDRSIFSRGAVMAAKWLQAQPNGVYTMRDFIQV